MCNVQFVEYQWPKFHVFKPMPISLSPRSYDKELSIIYFLIQFWPFELTATYAPVCLTKSLTLKLTCVWVCLTWPQIFMIFKKNVNGKDNKAMHLKIIYRRLDDVSHVFKRGSHQNEEADRGYLSPDSRSLSPSPSSSLPPLSLFSLPFSPFSLPSLFSPSPFLLSPSPFLSVSLYPVHPLQNILIWNQLKINCGHPGYNKKFVLYYFKLCCSWIKHTFSAFKINEE